MKLTAGEIYFIRETDKLTKRESSYIKIGLIREGEDRTSEDRALEHQTGNPRELHVFEKVQTHAVSEVENILHHFYANSRVSGEWFNLTPDLLTEAIDKARELAATATKNIKALERAEALKLTSTDMKKNGLVDAVIPEPVNGAHRSQEENFGNVKRAILSYLKELDQQTPEKRINDRIEKFNKMGVWK